MPSTTARRLAVDQIIKFHGLGLMAMRIIKISLGLGYYLIAKLFQSLKFINFTQFVEIVTSGLIILDRIFAEIDRLWWPLVILPWG